ncbi:MAG TPA: FAD-dependent oxidoreductase [Candidatus Dormibacteraeota bacterium]|nr:FAD-dependent oxidoreductase [Candidatus Dormibacteraeota bacterium]
MRSTSQAGFDVVVIGGGIQGLVALNALVDKGYSCALVSDGDLGSGQTLHSHGYLNTGFGMFGPELPRASVDVVQPYLEKRGLELSHDWILIPPPSMPLFEGLPTATLPSGFAAPSGFRAVRLPDRSLPKRRLVETLSESHHDRILRGHATPRWNGTQVEAVSVRGPGGGGEVVLPTKAVVVAAGCGSKRFLQRLVGQTPQTEQIKHRRVHMICVRAPRGTLPTTSIVAMPLSLMLAAHDQPSHVTWYVTPMEMGGPSYDDIPGDAASDVDSEMVLRGCATLLALYPRLPEIDGLQLGCYAGYRQDVGDQPGNRMCELVEGTENVIVALPSGLVGPWLNATRLCEIVSGLVDPGGSQPPLPGAGVGVRVGSAVEERPDFVWMGWDEWLRKYPQFSLQPFREK